MKTFLALCLWLCASTALAVNDAELARLGLVPRPKTLALHGTMWLRGPVDVGGMKDFPTCETWLRQVIEREFGPLAKEAATKAGCRIELVRAAMPHGPEAFRIQCAEGTIRLAAPTEAGMFRAVGRLAQLLDSPAAEHAAGKVRCPVMDLEDWPDMPTRGMHLQMAWQPHEKLINVTVDAMARLGFNMVGYEIGSRYEYHSHPECRRPGANWTRASVARIVAHAKTRGITPIPCLNAIGHADRAPLVCMLPDKNWQRRVMDLTQPAFYPTFFDLLDELIEVFDHPPYIHLGTDECSAALRRLAKLRARTPQSLYAEFVNRVTAHLEEKGVKAVIWSDMLLRPGEDVGPANASADCPTDLALAKLTKKVVIDYWNYSPSTYRGLDRLRAGGFTTWVSPWYNPAGVAHLCWKGYDVGSTAVLGTTWGDASRVADGMVLTAEYAWNAADKNRMVTYAPYAIANELYCGRGTWGPATAQPIRLQGGGTLPPALERHMADLGLPMKKTLRTRGLTFDLAQPDYFGSGEPKTLTGPKDILAAAHRGERLFVRLGPGRSFPIDGVNTDRGTAQTILYVREPGRTSTKTNRWGCEWVVRDGRVADILPPKERAGNATIPPDGFVLSAHGFQGSCGYTFLRRYLHPKDRPQILAFSMPKDSAEATADLGAKGHGVVILLTALQSPPAKADMVELTIQTASGATCRARLNGSLSLPGLRQLRWHYAPGRGDGWRLWPAWFDYDVEQAATVLAYEWRPKSPDDPGRKLHIVVKPEGRIYGTTLLGAVAW